jgi:hypothetical protein
LRINVLIGTTLIDLLESVFHYIFESQVKRCAGTPNRSRAAGSSYLDKEV